jgi:hypothetical protein
MTVLELALGISLIVALVIIVILARYAQLEIGDISQLKDLEPIDAT